MPSQNERLNLLGEQLRASEARWGALFEAAVDAIVVIDAAGRIEAFNPAAERLFGYSQQDVLGRNVNILMPPPFRQEHDHYLARYLATGTAKIIGLGREVQGVRKDGSTFPVHLSVGEIVVEGARKFAGILHDLTPRVQMEQQLREQVALAKLGEMAAVVAHEVKNPLAGVRGAIQIVGSHMDASHPHAGILKEIVARLDALDQMMTELLLFARTPEPRLQLTDLTTLVRSTAELLVQDPGLRGLRIDITGSAPPVLVDPALLKIVFQNLLLNGAHAMHGKGSLTVAVAGRGTTCDIVFQDEGPGIPADIRDKIFDPFFTTKARGSGLGLPTVKRLVEAHHGEVCIDCPPEGGTRVTLRLPLPPA